MNNHARDAYPRRSQSSRIKSLGNLLCAVLFPAATRGTGVRRSDQRLFLLAFLLALSGCGNAQKSARFPEQELAEPQTLLERGREYASRGESVRAEQYYRAAAEVGADEDVVFELSLETCVENGRLGSALNHVRERLRREPEERRLLRLAASLSRALGHERAAEHHARELSLLPNLAPDDDLFLGRFFAQLGNQGALALHHYERYLARTSAAEREPWVLVAKRRLVAEAPEFSRGQEGLSHE